ncbi:MAG: DUF1295 domain-containing protein [Hyphomicrobiales bacterium]|nr:DUF1295 domain-containing protein [Hyphomicrobiales bacterium]
MVLRERFVQQGDFLFRWRSFVPLVLAPILILTVSDDAWPMGDALEDWVEAACVFISLAGLAIRADAIGYAAPRSSGGNTKRQRADTLNTTGLYSVVRHPLYVGNALIWLGLILFNHTIWVIAFVCLFFAIYYERIMAAEERFLESRFGDVFRQWVDRVPAVVPDIRLWVPPDRRFDWRVVIRRDYGAAFSVVAIFTVLEVGGDWLEEGSLDVDPLWLAFFLLATGLYVVARVVKKRTRLLRSPSTR